MCINVAGLPDYWINKPNIVKSAPLISLFPTKQTKVLFSLLETKKSKGRLQQCLVAYLFSNLATLKRSFILCRSVLFLSQERFATKLFHVLMRRWVVLQLNWHINFTLSELLVRSLQQCLVAYLFSNLATLKRSFILCRSVLFLSQERFATKLFHVLMRRWVVLQLNWHINFTLSELLVRSVDFTVSTVCKSAHIYCVYIIHLYTLRTFLVEVVYCWYIQWSCSIPTRGPCAAFFAVVPDQILKVYIYALGLLTLKTAF